MDTPRCRHRQKLWHICTGISKAISSPLFLSIFWNDNSVWKTGTCSWGRNCLIIGAIASQIASSAACKNTTPNDGLILKGLALRMLPVFSQLIFAAAGKTTRTDQKFRLLGWHGFTRNGLPAVDAVSCNVLGNNNNYYYYINISCHRWETYA